MKERAFSCRDNPKHTCTQRKGPTVREDHLHLWLDKERSTHWNALLPYRRMQQCVYAVRKHPTHHSWSLYLYPECCVCVSLYLTAKKNSTVFCLKYEVRF